METLVSSILASYASKYLKNFSPGDLKLSLWGGDVVLRNLELRVEALEQDLPLPIGLISGRIHELRVNVPWTALTKEPVKVTLATLEFVVGPKQPRRQTNEGVRQTVEVASEAQPETGPESIENRASLINLITNNISVVVQNLVVKYVDNDVVLSLSCKSLSLWSATKDWQRAFTDYLGRHKLLHKVFEFSELTLCLDQRREDGKIEVYQDPILYRVSFYVRIRYFGETQGLLEPQLQANLHCRELSFVLSNEQHDMLFRMANTLGPAFEALGSEPPAPPKVANSSENRPQTPSETRESNDSETTSNDSWLTWTYGLMGGPVSSTSDPVPSSPPPVVKPTSQKKKLHVFFGLHFEKISLLLTIRTRPTEQHVKARKNLAVPAVRVDAADLSCVIWERIATKQRLIGMFIARLSASYFQPTARSLALRHRVSTSIITESPLGTEATWRTVVTSSALPVSDPSQLLCTQFLRSLTEGKSGDITLLMPSDFLGQISVLDRDMALKIDYVQDDLSHEAAQPTIPTLDGHFLTQSDKIADVTVSLGRYTIHLEYAFYEILIHYIADHFLFYRGLVVSTRRKGQLQLLGEHDLAVILGQRDVQLRRSSATVVFHATRVILQPAESYENFMSLSQSYSSSFAVPVVVLDIRSASIVSTDPPIIPLSSELDTTLNDFASNKRSTPHWTGYLFSHFTIQHHEIQASLSSLGDAVSSSPGDPYLRTCLTDPFNVHMVMHDAHVRRLGGDVWHSSLPLSRLDFRLPEFTLDLTRPQWLLLTYVLSSWLPNYATSPLNRLQAMTQNLPSPIVAAVMAEALGSPSNSLNEAQDKKARTGLLNIKIAIQNSSGSVVSMIAGRGMMTQLGGFEVSLHGFSKTNWTCEACKQDGELLIFRAPAHLKHRQGDGTAGISRSAFQLIFQVEKSGSVQDSLRPIQRVAVARVAPFELAIDPRFLQWFEQESWETSKSTDTTPASNLLNIQPQNVPISSVPKPQTKSQNDGDNGQELHSLLATHILIEMASAHVIIPSKHWHEFTTKDAHSNKPRPLTFAEMSMLTLEGAVPCESFVPLMHLVTPKIQLTNSDMSSLTWLSPLLTHPISLPIFVPARAAGLPLSWRISVTGGYAATLTPALHPATCMTINRSLASSVSASIQNPTAPTDYYRAVSRSSVAQYDTLTLVSDVALDGTFTYTTNRDPSIPSTLNGFVHFHPVLCTLSMPQIDLLWQIAYMLERTFKERSALQTQVTLSPSKTRHILRSVTSVTKSGSELGETEALSSNPPALPSLNWQAQQRSIATRPSLWLQVTASRLALHLLLQGPSTRSFALELVATEVEDVSFAIDQTEQSRTITLKVGSVAGKNLITSIRLNEKNMLDWQPGAFQGRLLLSNARMSPDADDGAFLLLRVRSRLSNANQVNATSSINTVLVDQMPSVDDNDDVLSTATSLNDELELSPPQHEITVNVQGLDVLLNLPLLVSLVLLANSSLRPLLTRSTASSNTEPQSEVYPSTSPRITASFGSLRILVGLEAADELKHQATGKVLVLQLGASTTKTDPEHPIHRLNADLTEVLGPNWIARDNFQYQMDLQEISIYETTIDEVAFIAPGSSSFQGSEEGRNPALDWNAFIPPVHSSILLQPFDVRIVYAPPATNFPSDLPQPTVSASYRQLSLLFSHVVEVQSNTTMSLSVSIEHIRTVLTLAKSFEAQLQPLQWPSSSSSSNADHREASQGSALLINTSLPGLRISLDWSERPVFVPNHSLVSFMERTSTSSRNTNIQDTLRLDLIQLQGTMWFLRNKEREIVLTVDDIAAQVPGESKKLVTAVATHRIETTLQTAQRFLRIHLVETHINDLSHQQINKRQITIESGRSLNVTIEPILVTSIRALVSRLILLRSFTSKTMSTPPIPTQPKPHNVVSAISICLGPMAICLRAPVSGNSTSLTLGLEQCIFAVTETKGASVADIFAPYSQRLEEGELFVTGVYVGLTSNLEKEWILVPNNFEGTIASQRLLYLSPLVDSLTSVPPAERTAGKLILKATGPVEFDLTATLMARLQQLTSAFSSSTISSNTPDAPPASSPELWKTDWVFKTPDDLRSPWWNVRQISTESHGLQTSTENYCQPCKTGELVLDFHECEIRWRYSAPRAVTCVRLLSIAQITPANGDALTPSQPNWQDPVTEALKETVFELQCVDEATGLAEEVAQFSLTSSGTIADLLSIHGATQNLRSSTTWRVRARVCVAPKHESPEPDSPDDPKGRLAYGYALLPLLRTALQIDSVHIALFVAPITVAVQVSTLQVHFHMPYSDVNGKYDGRVLRVRTSDLTLAVCQAQTVMNKSVIKVGLYVHVSAAVLDPRDLRYTPILSFSLLTCIRRKEGKSLLVFGLDSGELFCIDSQLMTLLKLTTAWTNFLHGQQNPDQLSLKAYELINTTDCDIVFRQSGSKERQLMPARSRVSYTWHNRRESTTTATIEVAVSTVVDELQNAEVWSAPITLDKPSVGTRMSARVHAQSLISSKTANTRTSAIVSSPSVSTHSIVLPVTLIAEVKPKPNASYGRVLTLMGSFVISNHTSLTFEVLLSGADMVAPSASAPNKSAVLPPYEKFSQLVLLDSRKPLQSFLQVGLPVVGMVSPRIPLNLAVGTAIRYALEFCDEASAEWMVCMDICRTRHRLLLFLSPPLVIRNCSDSPVAVSVGNPPLKASLSSSKLSLSSFSPPLDTEEANEDGLTAKNLSRPATPSQVSPTSTAIGSSEELWVEPGQSVPVFWRFSKANGLQLGAKCDDDSMMWSGAAREPWQALPTIRSTSFDATTSASSTRVRESIKTSLCRVSEISLSSRVDVRYCRTVKNSLSSFAVSVDPTLKKNRDNAVWIVRSVKTTSGSAYGSLNLSSVSLELHSVQLLWNRTLNRTLFLRTDGSPGWVECTPGQTVPVGFLSSPRLISEPFALDVRRSRGWFLASPGERVVFSIGWRTNDADPEPTWSELLAVEDIDLLPEPSTTFSDVLSEATNLQRLNTETVHNQTHPPTSNEPVKEQRIRSYTTSVAVIDRPDIVSGLMVGRDSVGQLLFSDAAQLYNHSPVDLLVRLEHVSKRESTSSTSFSVDIVCKTQAACTLSMPSNEKSNIMSVYATLEPIISSNNIDSVTNTPLSWIISRRRLAITESGSVLVLMHRPHDGVTYLFSVVISRPIGSGLRVDVVEDENASIKLLNFTGQALYILPTQPKSESQLKHLVKIPPHQDGNQCIPYDLYAFLDESLWDDEAAHIVWVASTPLSGQRSWSRLSLAAPGQIVVALHNESDRNSTLSIVVQISTTARGRQVTFRLGDNLQGNQVSTVTRGAAATPWQLVAKISELVLRVYDDSFNSNTPVPLLTALMTNVEIKVDVHHEQQVWRGNSNIRSFVFSLGTIQIDNHLEGFEFPVVLCTRNPSKDNPLTITADLTDGYKQGGFVVERVAITMQPLAIYIEDAFINHITQRIKRACEPIVLAVTSLMNKLQPAQKPSKPAAFTSPSLTRLRIESIEIRPISATVSLNASVRLLFAFESMPIDFPEVSYHMISSHPVRLMEIIAAHYVADLVLRMPALLGSLQVFGNPTGLFTSIATGLRNFIALPSTAAALGPRAFVVGLGQGTGSLVHHVSHGILNSMSNFCNALSRNLDQLTFDHYYITWQQSQRLVRPRGLTDGIAQGTWMLGSNVASGLLGLVQQPLQGMIENESFVAGAIGGLGRGLIGAVAKPVSGVLQLVVNTTDGFLGSVGWGDKRQYERQHPVYVSRISSNMLARRLVNVSIETDILVVVDGWTFAHPEAVIIMTTDAKLAIISLSFQFDQVWYTPQIERGTPEIEGCRLSINCTPSNIVFNTNDAIDAALLHYHLLRTLHPINSVFVL